MYYNGIIYYNNLGHNQYSGLTVIEPPKIEHSKILGDEFVIPGRNGVLYSRDTYRGNATITVKFALYKPEYESGYTSDSYHNSLKNIRHWLTGTGNLIIGSDSNALYEVQKVEIVTDERVIVNYGIIEVVFTVYPFEFKSTPTKTNWQIGVDQTDTIYFNTDTCEPLYKVVTGSNGGKVTINGNEITVAASETFYIDVRRKIAYSGSTNKSDKLSGDYADMVIKNGNNVFTTDAGMTFTIVSSRDGFVI